MKSNPPGDEHNSNIVIDDDRFMVFKKNLKAEYNRLKKGNTYKNNKKLKNIIHEVILLKKHYINKSFEFGNLDDRKNIETNLESLYGKYFDGFNNKSKLLNHIFINSGNFFNLKKLFQLSRIYGIINEDGDFKKLFPIEIQHYFHFIVFLDYYESFPRYLLPVLKYTWEESGGHVWIGRYHTRDYYNILYKIVPTFKIKYKKIMNTYRTLRNDIAHSSVFFKKNIYEIYSTPGSNIPEQNNIKKKMEEILDFETMAVIYATEFDIRVLKLGLDGNDDGIKKWMDFFKIYNDCWQKIGPPIDLEDR